MPHFTRDTVVLSAGSHNDGYDPDDPNCEVCFFEAYNLLRDDPTEEVSDDCPPGVSEVLHCFGIQLNDNLPHDLRQKLKRFLPGPDGVSPLAGTADDGLDRVRAYLTVDWMIRNYVPSWLTMAELHNEAETLGRLPEIVDDATREAAGLAIRAIAGTTRRAVEASAPSGPKSDAEVSWRAGMNCAVREAAEASKENAAEVGTDAAGEWSDGQAKMIRLAQEAARDAMYLTALPRVVAAMGALPPGPPAEPTLYAWAAAHNAAQAALAFVVRVLQDSLIDLFEEMVSPTRRA